MVAKELGYKPFPVSYGSLLKYAAIITKDGFKLEEQFWDDKQGNIGKWPGPYAKWNGRRKEMATINDKIDQAIRDIK